MLLSKATYICATYKVYTIFTFTLMAHCTSGAIKGFSVLLKDASTGNRTSNLLITNRLLYLLRHCRPPLFPHRSHVRPYRHTWMPHWTLTSPTSQARPDCAAACSVRARAAVCGRTPTPTTTCISTPRASARRRGTGDTGAPGYPHSVTSRPWLTSSPASAMRVSSAPLRALSWFPRLRWSFRCSPPQSAQQLSL